MASDPATMLGRAPMSRFQWQTVAVMIGLNALDGFDVLSISFAAPGIARQWGIDRAALGVVLSMELIGMALGSVLLGGAADRFGRRPTILGCLVAMAIGMMGASQAGGIVPLCAWRVVTGLGIGGMLAATNAAVAEAANDRRRSLCVVLMAGGYPVGTIIGGLASSWLLQRFDWPAIFLFGAGATACFVPLVLWRAPESIGFLVARRPTGALDRINRTLTRMGQCAIDLLPPPIAQDHRAGLAELFAAGRAPLTAMLTLAYLAHIMTFYFVVKWIPKLVVDLGFAPAAAAGVLVWASIGGAIGSIGLGLLTARVRVRTLTMVAMFASLVLVILFGQGQRSLGGLSAIGAFAGFATNAGVVGLYALMAQSYPATLRGTATGFVIGIGRGGSALAPALAGVLFAAGQTLATVAAIMALGSLVGALALLSIRRRLDRSMVEGAAMAR